MQKQEGCSPDPRDDSWASESLPMAVRRELLERELRRLGFRRRGGGEARAAQQQQLQPAGGSHPRAGGPSADDHGD